MENSYGIENIQHLDTRNAMRTRIGVYLGSDDTEGMYQAFKEIINNATDEANVGYGKEIDIQVDENTSTIQVRDFGRGVPFGIKDGKNILVSIYTESHTGGKFDKNAYKNSAGLNGLGGTAVCMSSVFFYVRSIRDGKIAEAEFEEGTLKNYKETLIKDYEKELGRPVGETGTYIKFRPDEKVFINAEKGFSYERICSEIKNISYLNKGVKFVVEDMNNNKETYYSENGIADFILEKIKKPLMKAPIIISKKDDVDELEIAFMWTGDSEQSYVFVNGLYVPQGGAPITGAKRTITTMVKKKSGCDLDADLIRKGLVYAINCKVANPSFEGQVKSKINNSNLSTLASQAFKEGLEQFFNTSESSVIIEMIKKFQKAEDAAERERQKVLNIDREVEKETKKKSVMGTKLKDCRIHDENSILYITEGDSALGSFTLSRDSTYVAAIPIRGKIINALKHSKEEVLENEEVKDLVKVSGCGIFEKTNVKKLRYGKIAFAADADPDGLAIICLLIVLYHELMPATIDEGKIYWAQFPLYEITIGKQKMFAYDDKERDEILKKYPSAHVDRNKGLGEMDPDAFAEAAFGPKARLVQITRNDVEAAKEMLELLLGPKTDARSEYIFNNIDFSVVDGE